MYSFADIPEKRVAEYGVFTALLNSGMILSCSNYDIKAPKGKFQSLRNSLRNFILVAAPPPEPVVAEIPVEEKVEDKKKEAAAAKGKKKGKATEVEAPPVVSCLQHSLHNSILIVYISQIIL